jgi:hypothetical protein
MDGAVYIERKIEDWDYHAKTTRRVAKNAIGFTRKLEEWSDVPRGVPLSESGMSDKA